ncbi:MAG: TonB-dependent hemoglobin/transferrin/lactoferrin family receptor [Leptolyngbyaceae cyanobacterium SM2_3_12]|nr:TonB-dependent hemoglobin/transferrin/lactoferrin family receptor [Leptolyngbyaceae cyanobacterium SM2_3_12]
MEFPEDGRLRITVTGTRNPREVDTLPATVTVFDLEDIQFLQIQNLQDLLRYEPGVSVRDDPRFGLQDINIRGIEGNRILFQLDGIRLPERFEFGPFNIGRGDYVDFNTLQTVEVLRGPASTLYGSDALGGVISFRSIEPRDLLGAGDVFGGDAFTTFLSETGGFGSAVRTAARYGPVEGIFVYSRRDGREANVRSDPAFINPQDSNGNTFFGNVAYAINDTNRLSLIAEDFNRDTRITTAPANLDATTTSFVEDILIDRTRFSLTYEFDDNENPSFLQFARAQVFYQDATETERNFENRTTGGIPVFRDTNNQFIADSYGGDVQLRSDFFTGDVFHQLTYGLEISNTFNSRPRDRVQTNLVTGESSRNIPPDVFPVKDFPDGNTLRLGVYLQDEIEIGPVDIIAGLRFDYYDLTTSPDDDFSRNGAESADLNASALSPRIAAFYSITPEIGLYGQYARGFRAPLYSEINSGFTNTAGRFFKYQTISNPDLEPETSNSFEVGVRGNYPQFDVRLTGFYNTYNNFIETFQPAGTRCLVDADPCPQGGPAGTQVVNIFQTQNISNARIFGVEAGGEYRFDPRGYGFSLLASLAWVQGDDLTANVPLSTVDPFTAVAGLRYRAPGDQWQAEFISTLVGTPRVEPEATTFVPDAYVVFDLIGSYQATPGLALNLGVYNLFNTRYFNYSDVRNQPADDPSINRLSQPGLNVRLGVNYAFKR